MAVVDTWLHIIGLLSCIIIFVVSLQQIFITSIFDERPKSIYRIMTSIMVFIEVLLHFFASLWYESQSPSLILTIIIHILRLFSAITISVTFYPILITTIQHFYNSREFKDQLKVPKWLLAPWKYIISSVIIVCIICYIIVFIENSLSALFFYYIIADFSSLCACITVGTAIIDVYFKVQETGKSIESQTITKQNTFELQQATKEINKSKYFMIILIIIIILAATRSMYILYDNIQNKQYYDKSTLKTMPMETLQAYLGSIIFVWVYDIGLIAWLWKSNRFDPTLQRVNTNLKDEPKEKKPIKTRDITEEENNKVTDELGHIVDEEYNDDTIIDEREQTNVIIDNMLNKRATVTPALQHTFKLSQDLDGLHFIKCKIIIYLFDLVITNCSAAILYKKTSAQIYKMDNKRFNKQFGGIHRIKIIEKHIQKMSKGAILYCITGKMNINTLEAIMDRLNLLKYFKGTISNELIDYLNQNSTVTMDRNISETQSPTTTATNNINVHIPSKLSKLATLDEDDSLAVLDNKLDENHDDDNKDNDMRNMESIGDMRNMEKFRSDQSIGSGVDIKINILKFEGDNLTKEIENVYQQRLLAKNSDIMKETKGNAQINLLLFKFLKYYDVLNDEILVISNDVETISYFKSIGLCKGYHISGGKGLNHNHIKEIQHYL